MGISELLMNSALRERYMKVKKYFYLRESSYDVSNVCQLRCDGCYYFQGEKYSKQSVQNSEAWKSFFLSERSRGINYAILAGAEPALVPKILRACCQVIDLGTIATNGLRVIDNDLRYRIHISVWGDAANDVLYRPRLSRRQAGSWLSTQLKNYKQDDRVVFVYTFNSRNAGQLNEVLRILDGEGAKITFNVFSEPENTCSKLRVGSGLEEIREKMLESIETYPNTVIYSPYNALVHTSPVSLNELFECPYPRAQLRTSKDLSGLGLSFRNYRVDMTHTPEHNCCIPDTACESCRHYAAGSAIVSSRLNLHIESEASFRGWLDYVDTYLAVWVLGYQRSQNLFDYSLHSSEALPSVAKRLQSDRRLQSE